VRTPFSQLSEVLSKGFGGKEVKIKAFKDVNGKIFVGEELKDLMKAAEPKQG